MRERELMARGHDRVSARRIALEMLGDLSNVRRQMEALGMERDRAAHTSRWWSEIAGDVLPLTFIGVALLLPLVAFGAALVPARRAARVPPTEALGS